MTNGSSNPAGISEPAAGRRRRKEARPGEIIAAGLAEFGARGFEATRMEDVARRAGIAKGTVFRYFPTKEALFEAAVVSRIAPVFDRLSEAVDAHDGPCLALLETAITRIYAELDEPELTTLMRVIIAEGSRFPAIVESYHRLSISRAQGVLGRIVARGIAAGEFRSGAVADLPMVLVAPAIMAAVWRMTFDRVQHVPLGRFHAAHREMLAGALLALPVSTS
jgi:AcrR family transcriptional regulator